MRHLNILITLIGALVLFGAPDVSGANQVPKVERDVPAERILVILRDIGTNDQDIGRIAADARETGDFDLVLTPSYDWRKELTPAASRRIFLDLQQRFPSALFVLQGTGKGGLIARWVAERVPEAQGRVERVVLIEVPNQGLSSSAISGLSRQYSLSTSSDVLKELQPWSDTIHALEQAPVNDLRSVGVSQIHDLSSEMSVTCDSALFGPSSNRYGSLDTQVASTGNSTILLVDKSARTPWPTVVSKEIEEALHTDNVSHEANPTRGGGRGPSDPVGPTVDQGGSASPVDPSDLPVADVAPGTNTYSTQMNGKGAQTAQDRSTDTGGRSPQQVRDQMIAELLRLQKDRMAAEDQRALDGAKSVVAATEFLGKLKDFLPDGPVKTGAKVAKVSADVEKSGELFFEACTKWQEGDKKGAAFALHAAAEKVKTIAEDALGTEASLSDLVRKTLAHEEKARLALSEGRYGDAVGEMADGLLQIGAGTADLAKGANPGFGKVVKFLCDTVPSFGRLARAWVNTTIDDKLVDSNSKAIQDLYNRIQQYSADHHMPPYKGRWQAGISDRLKQLYRAYSDRANSQFARLRGRFSGGLMGLIEWLIEMLEDALDSVLTKF